MRVSHLMRLGLAYAALIVAGWLVTGLIVDLNRIKVLKTDLAEIQHMRYGFLDANAWVERVSAVIDKRVEDLDLTEASRARAVEGVTRVLDALSLEIERSLAQGAAGAGSGGSWVGQLQGLLQKGLQELLLDLVRLRERAPEYAESLVDQLSVPGVKEQIKAQLRAFLRDAVAVDPAAVDRGRLQAVLDRYGCEDVDACSRLLQSRVEHSQDGIAERLAIALGLVVTLFAVLLLVPARRAKVVVTLPSPEGGKGQGPAAGLEQGGAGDPGANVESAASVWTRRPDLPALIALTGATLLLLIGGLATPMIEVDARIGELRLILLGEPVVFADQVVYFQTKSILDVMRILFESAQPEMLLVAILLTLFSVLFPTLKFLATYAYYFDFGPARRSPLLRFFALRSGKWSMADVMVVAIFMAYIGFDALVGQQLGSLARHSGTVSVLTSESTSLEPGFYLFLSFVLATLVVSSALESGSGGDEGTEAGRGRG